MPDQQKARMATHVALNYAECQVLNNSTKLWKIVFCESNRRPGEIWPLTSQITAVTFSHVSFSCAGLGLPGSFGPRFLIVVA
jgi:hypothetical protein